MSAVSPSQTHRHTSTSPDLNHRAATARYLHDSADASPDERLRLLDEAALKAEDIRAREVGPHGRARTPPPRFKSTDVPERPSLPTRLHAGWRRDGETHGWFGGTPAQFEFMQAQQNKIAQLRSELDTAHSALRRPRAYGASCSSTSPSPPATPSTTRPPQPMPSQPVLQPYCGPRAGGCATSGSRPARARTPPPPSRVARPQSAAASHAHGGVTDRSIISAGDDPRRAAELEAELSAAADSLRAMHAKLASVEADLAAERSRRVAFEKALAIEKRAAADAKAEAERERAAAAKAVASAQAESLRCRAEVDRIKWQLKRQ